MRLKMRKKNEKKKANIPSQAKQKTLDVNPKPYDRHNLSWCVLEYKMYHILTNINMAHREMYGLQRDKHSFRSIHGVCALYLPLSDANVALLRAR